MTFNHRVVKPSVIPGTVFSESGERLTPPEGWAFLQAGDAAITRSVKAKGETWVVQVQKGRRIISRGIWAREKDILESTEEVLAKRSTPEYEKKRKNDLVRKEIKHKAYVQEFRTAVVSFLDFHPRYQEEAQLLGEKIADHATPVGSGTVARTQRIPITERAEAAVIAWMRHQTTAYDSMRIARIKGRRGEVRKKLAAKSMALLQCYRQGQIPDENCPLKKAML